MLPSQVSLEKEDEGLAGLLPGGERVSAGSWGPLPLPGSSPQPHLHPWGGRVSVRSRLDTFLEGSPFTLPVVDAELASGDHMSLQTCCPASTRPETFSNFFPTPAVWEVWFLIKFPHRKPLNDQEVWPGQTPVLRDDSAPPGGGLRGVPRL